jgi:hypothetical protein
MAVPLLRAVAMVLAVAIALVSPSVRAQTTPAAAIEVPAPPAPGDAAPAPELETWPAGTLAPVPPTFRAEQLDQLLAPIALYPDALLAQILMATTYPLEVVKASRWLRDPRHTALSGDQLAAAVEAATWDPSIKALMNVPQILTMMDANLDWTEQLGDSFVAQQADVMDAVQRLRYEAAAAGTLWSNAQQRVAEEGQGIVIEPENPAYIYPPLYNSNFVYGPWPSPEYPPLDIAPTDFDVGSALPFGISFGGGFVVVKKIWPWCAFDWAQRRIRLNTPASEALAHPTPGSGSAVWRHEPEHRHGLAFFDPGARERFGVRRDRPAAVAAIPRIAVPQVAGTSPIVLSRPALRAFTPARVRPVALVLPVHHIAGRPMMMPPPAPRQPAAWAAPRAVAGTKAAPIGGGSHSDGASHR